MSPINNVHGIERALSIAAGLTTIAAGVRRGGTLGVVRALGGVLILQRGLSGHCAVKGLIMDPEAEIDCLRQRIAKLRAALPDVDDYPSQARRRLEEKVDHAVEETFPASDPISP